MLSSAPAVSPKPAALPPAAQPTLPGPGSAGGPSFARFLNDQPDLLPPPNHTDPVPKETDTAGEATAAPAPAASTAPARRKDGAAKPAAPAQDRTPESAAPPARPADKTQACDNGSEVADEATEADQDPETAGLSEFTQLIGLNLPAQPVVATTPAVTVTAAADTNTDSAAQRVLGAPGPRVARATPATADEAAAPAERDDAAEPTASTGERRPTDTRARASDTPRARSLELAADKAAAARSGAGNDALQAAASAPADATPRKATALEGIAPTSFAAVLAQAQPAATPAASPPPAAGRVHAALQSNAFGPELAASVSLLAVDGVQSAELQLNPAEMGPVAVQIVVDGSQAQVSFHAAQAETRHALEQSLPDLAAALQGQGLTLSGGGVFQQAPRDTRGGDAQTASDDGRGARADTRGGRVGATGNTTVQAPVRRAVGLLDTFA